MSEGFVAEHVHVVDAETREPLDRSALADGTRALGPRADARDRPVRSGAASSAALAPHREAGYPLREGVAVEVVVDDGFADAEGRPLAGACHRRYRVVGDVRRRIEPDEWEVRGSRRPARAIPWSFDSIAPSTTRCSSAASTVVDADAGPVSGRIVIPAGERSWEFTPLEEWRDAGYVLVVDTMLEDLAGNSVARVFDRDLADADHTPIAARTVTLDFHPT